MTRPLAPRFELGARIDGDDHAVLLLALRQAKPGVGLEFGVAQGTTLALIAAAMPAVGFDSFEGLPADWRPRFPAGMFACEQPTVPNARIVAGWFDVTLPRYDFAKLGDIALVHIDCDLYSSTATVLEYVMPHLSAGAILVFDEWHGYLGCEMHEQRAWREYTREHPDVAWRVIGHGREQWAIRLL